MNRLVNGGAKVNLHILESMLDLYDIGGDRWPGLIEMAGSGWAEGVVASVWAGAAGTYVDFETEVEELFTFELTVVPGRLQAAEYARTHVRECYRGRRDADDIVRRQVAVRIARQERLTGEDTSVWPW